MGLTLALAAVFLSVALAAGTATHAVLAERAPARRRLRDFVRADNDARHLARPAAPTALTATPHPLAVRLAALLPRSAGRIAEIRQRLACAGYRASSAPVAFTAAQVGFAIGGALLVGGAAGFSNISWPALGALAGAMLPEFWLVNARQQRYEAIANGMPDALDLLVICLEAGCSLDQAITRSVDELRRSRPEIADELGWVIHEIRAGQSRAEAFRQFGVRAAIDEVRALVSILVQTDRYGTSITQALKLHAGVCRTRRRQRAEERAGKASVKMVFPLVLFLFPAFFLLALGPTMLEFYRALTAAVR
jgi:tight adherence protein C